MFIGAINLKTNDIDAYQKETEQALIAARKAINNGEANLIESYDTYIPSPPGPSDKIKRHSKDTYRASIWQATNSQRVVVKNYEIPASVMHEYIEPPVTF